MQPRFPVLEYLCAVLLVSILFCSDWIAAKNKHIAYWKRKLFWIYGSLFAAAGGSGGKIATITTLAVGSQDVYCEYSYLFYFDPDQYFFHRQILKECLLLSSSNKFGVFSSCWPTRDHIGRSTGNSNPVMTSSAGGAKGCSDHRFRAPPAYSTSTQSQQPV